MTEEIQEALEADDTVAAEDALVDAVAPAPEWTEEDKEAAKMLGWKDPDEWEGEKPEGFIDDPRRFLERAESFGPFRKLKEQMEAQGESLRKIESVTAKAVERAREQEKQRYEAEIAAIREGQRRAVEEADTEAFDKLEERRGKIAPPDDEPEVDAAHDLTPFVKDHAWLNDPVLKNQGGLLVQQALDRGEVKPHDTAAQVAYAAEKLATYYPHMFGGQPKPKPAASPVAGDVIAPSRKKTGFDSLPSDAKSAFASQVKQGIFADNAEDKEFFYNEYVNA